MKIRPWLLGACVVAGLGCNAGGGGLPGPQDAGLTQCPSHQRRCGTGCIPQGAECCDAATTSYCTNDAGGGCNRDSTCSAAFPGTGTAAYCCAKNANIGSNDCPTGQHHCGLACRPVNVGCCARATDFCTPGPKGDDGGTDASVDAGADAGVDADVDAGLDAGAGQDAATTNGDASMPTADDRCCSCNFDVNCTEFGAGGCWMCSNETYDSKNVCPAPMGAVISSGPCDCDPALYQICN